MEVALPTEVVFDAVLDALALELREHSAPVPDPLPCDTWIGRSVLQKAIRRGMLRLALGAAAQLLLIDKRALWRRLLVTALEDLGPHEMGTTARIVAAARNSRWRSQVGGDWAVIAQLVRSACEGTRCQSANDLWNIALHDPLLSDAKADFCELSETELVALATTDPDGGARGAAALMLMGHLADYSGRTAPQALFEAFGGNAETAVCREAFRLTRVPLPGLMLCLLMKPVQVIAHTDDPTSSVVWNGEVPTFAMDQYTRSGRALIRDFALGSRQWNALCDYEQIARGDRIAAAGELVFRVDGAAATQRLIGADRLQLRRRSAPLGCHLPPTLVPAATAIIRRQLPYLDKSRAAYKLT